MYSAKKEMGSTDESYSNTVYEPNSYDLMETYVESLTESLTEQQFPEQRFLEDVDYDDAALEEMLYNAHREHVYHSQREGLSVGQSSSSVSERTERQDVERTERPVVERGQELNTEHAHCQAEMMRHEFQANYDRRSIQKLSETVESQQGRSSLRSSRRTSKTRSTTSSCTVIAAKLGIS